MKLFFINLLLTFVAATSFAQNASQLRLIENDRRPMVEQILSDPQNLQSFATGTQNSRDHAFESNFATLIVSLEMAFPNATYGFLGRDMDLIADAAEAYYRSIGQPNRVRRIEFSTPSLQGSTPELITKFLAQLGLNIDKNIQKEAFVLIDFTSFAKQGRNDATFPSQARHILASVVTYLKQTGLNSKEIAERVNLATLDPHASGNVLELLNPFQGSISDFKNNQIADLERTGTFNRIAYLPVGGDTMAYYSEWNDKYGPIRRLADGTLATSPSAYFTRTVKTEVFGKIVSILNKVLSPAMGQKITTLAAQYRVTFQAPKPLAKVAQTKTIKPVKINYDLKLKESLTKLSAALPEMDTTKQYDKVKVPNAKIKLTENGEAVLLTLIQTESVQAENYFEISLSTLISLYKKDKIGARDFRRIFAHIISLKPIKSATMSQFVASNYKSILPLEIMFGRDEEIVKYSSQGGAAEQNYKLILQNSQIKPSCRFSYGTN